ARPGLDARLRVRPAAGVRAGPQAARRPPRGGARPARRRGEGGNAARDAAGAPDASGETHRGTGAAGGGGGIAAAVRPGPYREGRPRRGPRPVRGAEEEGRGAGEADARPAADVGLLLAGDQPGAGGRAADEGFLPAAV